MPDLSGLMPEAEKKGAVRALSPLGTAIAVGMFAAAVAAPIALPYLLPAETTRAAFTPQAARTSHTLSETPLFSVRTASTLEEASAQIVAGQFDGPVVPGQQAAGIVLGDPIVPLLAELPEDLVRTTELGAGANVHDIPVADLTIRIAGEAGKVSRVSLIATDCASLRFHQERRINASMTGGLAIGSHISRVVPKLGAPLSRKPDVGPQVAGTGYLQVYPGMEIGYCGESLLVRSISVFEDPTVEHGPRAPASPPDAIALVPVSEIAEPDTPSAIPPVMADRRLAAVPLAARSPDTPSVPAGPGEPAPVVSEPRGDHLLLEVADRSGATRVTPEPEPKLADAPPPIELLEHELAVLGALPRDAIAVEMSRRERRSAQIRLKLIGFDPRGADGIFGPRTADAIQLFQANAGLPPTGVMDETTRVALLERSEGKWQSWVSKQRRLAQLRARERAERERAEAAGVLISQAPKPRAAPECARNLKGVIIENQSFSCDLVVLREGLRELFDFSG